MPPCREMCKSPEARGRLLGSEKERERVGEAKK